MYENNTPPEPKEAVDQIEAKDLTLYLQRAEVRLSTQQRVAGAFIGGAGLLMLFPVVLKDAATRIFTSLIGLITPLFSTNTPFSTENFVPFAAILLMICFLISLSIPLFALFLLIKDLVLFYFAGVFPEYGEYTEERKKEVEGLQDKLSDISGKPINLHYLQVLSDILEQFDDLNNQKISNLKNEISAYTQSHKRNKGLTKEEHEKLTGRRAEIEQVINEQLNEIRKKEFLPSFIVPASVFPVGVGLEEGTRETKSKKIKERIMAFGYEIRLTGFLGDHLQQKVDNTLYSTLPTRKLPSLEDEERINKLFSKAGVVDRTLCEEVAFTEIALARNSVNLRELVLRYVKAMIASIWTTIVLFAIIAAIETSCKWNGVHEYLFNAVFWMSVWYFVWGLGILYFVHKPLMWISSLIKKNFGVKEWFQTAEPTLKSFQKIVNYVMFLVLLLSALSILLFWYGKKDLKNIESYLSCSAVPSTIFQQQFKP